MNFNQEFPRSGNAADLTHILIDASDLLQQNLNPRDPNHIQKGGLISTWDFIGFTDLQESISHQWEPYASIQGRLNELIKTERESVGKLGSLVSSVGGGINGGSVSSALNSGSTSSAKYKVDSPLVYTGSQRRQLSLTFQLAYWNDAYSDVLQPIHEFRRLSCAGIEGKSVDIIDFPAIFSLRTTPQSFFDIKDCVLTDVQITWKSPYSWGNPMAAELNLTFLDLRPLYKSSWGDAAGTITTSVDGKFGYGGGV